MTFVVREGSTYDGEPIALYEFRRGGISRCYSSGDQDIVAGGEVYAATPIEDAGVNQKGTAVTDVFEMTTPADIDVVQWFTGTPPSDTVYIVVRRFHAGDTDSVIVWLGQVVSVELLQEDKAKISCQAVSITLKRSGLRLTWQRGCNHALYDHRCRVNPQEYKRVTHVTAVTTEALTLAEPMGSDAYWRGGMITFAVGEGGVIEKRLIQEILGPESGVVYPFGDTDGFYVGQEVAIYPGCKRVAQWCANFFHNSDNYGGFQWMTVQTPYNGDPVF